jgi:hypothetical protein
VSALGCPFCAGVNLTVVEGCVVCTECTASGPWVQGDDRGAVARWNQRLGDDPAIRLEESPNATGGLRMALYYGSALCVLVEHVPEPFAATMRGALMLVGGMAKSNDLEADG